MASEALSFDPRTIPLDQIDVSNPALYQQDTHWPVMFERLRAEDPVHYCAKSEYGPFWSITRYNDIMAVDTNHRLFSSHNATALDDARIVGEGDGSVPIPSFLQMDPPKHDQQRKAVSPAVAPANLVLLEDTIRQRSRNVLDSLPIGTEFDWVEAVSVELTILMLATLIDFPLEERGKLKRWSDVIVGFPGDGIVESWDQRNREMRELAETFLKLKAERTKAAPTNDAISILAHSAERQDMDPVEFVANVTLLIVGGNETTRNTMSGSVLALHDFPAEWKKLQNDPALITSMVPEAIRWQSPVMYQSRRATEDVEFGGKLIRKGDKVAMWYISGNRDGEVIEEPDRFFVDRERPRQHLSFGFGIHRCLGNRLAEMQLRILWEEILARGWQRIEVTGTPIYGYSNTLRGINTLPVRIHA
ncbi:MULTISPECIES: cytochrome P450 [unclassified Sphingobium]|uniref:cytochrome P450 n=1 Tax=unclassified Sphingobium TaxID=2611147 RepID=UPI0035A70D88